MIMVGEETSMVDGGTRRGRKDVQGHALPGWISQEENVVVGKGKLLGQAVSCKDIHTKHLLLS